MTRPRGFTPWAPLAAGIEMVDNVQAVLEEYRAHLPMTIRQIFYRLVIKGQIDKTEKGYKRLCEHLNRARRAEMIPMSSIRDDGTTVSKGYNYNDEADLSYSLQWYAENAAMDLQAGQAERLEFWCEAAGMVPQIARVAHRYGVHVVSSGGFDSVTGKYRMAERYSGYSNLCVTVLHLGDYDPSGVHMFSSLQEDVSAFVTSIGGVVEFERLLVRPEHIESYNLPTAPPKATDRRSFNDNRTVQAEAFDPATLAQLVEGAIQARIDGDIFDQAFEDQLRVQTVMMDRFN